MPKKRNTLPNPRIVFSLRWPEDLRDEVEALAARSGMTINGYLISTLRTHVDRLKREDRS